VIKPLKLIIDNYPEDQTEWLDACNYPDNDTDIRKVPFTRELWIERDDFEETPPKGFFRLYPGNEVRLRWGFFVKCVSLDKDADGNVTAIHCTYDPASRGGNSPDGRKVKSTIHWVSAAHAVAAEIRLYDKLFTKEDPNDVPEGQDFTANLNPNSLVKVQGWLEPSLVEAQPGDRYQFERLAYFCADKSSTKEKPVFNRTVELRDAWAKEKKKA
jgi:glutaminyl-tRNA synthetase